MSPLEVIINKINLVYIDRESVDTPVAQRIFAAFPANRISIVDTPPDSNHKGRLTAAQFEESKKNVFVTPFKGSFFKRCPGAKKKLACCNYFVLNLGLQCDMNCSYCYLQSYINTPYLTIYSNIEQALLELKENYSDIGESPVRVGTGETIDSLSLDPLTLYSRDLVHFFKNEAPNWQLEFKTKSNYVDQFLDCGPAKNIIVSWSINPQYVVEREEHGTASLDSRLTAARKCLDGGFQVSFHLDPLIYFDEWQNHYEKLVREIHSRFAPQEIPYMSLGSLRYQHEQRPMMVQRFGMNSLANSGEMFRGKDGKLRYDFQMRNKMYKFIGDLFKELDPKWNIFLCMETPESWIKSFTEVPFRKEGLKSLFQPIVQTKNDCASPRA